MRMVRRNPRAFFVNVHLHFDNPQLVAFVLFLSLVLAFRPSTVAEMSSCYSSRRSSVAGEVNLALPGAKHLETSHSPPRSWFEVSSHASQEGQRESKSEHLDFDALVYKLQRHQLNVEEDELRANLESSVLPQEDGSVLSNLVTSEWQSPAAAGEDTEITALPVEEFHEHEEVKPVILRGKASTSGSASERSRDRAASPTNSNRHDRFKWSSASKMGWESPEVIAEGVNSPNRSRSQLGLESDLPNLVTSEWDAPAPAYDNNNENAHLTPCSMSQLQRHDSVMDNLVTSEWGTIDPICEDENRIIPVVKEDHCDEADIPNLVTSEWGSSETAADHSDNLRVPRSLWRTSAFSLANLVTSEWQTPTEEETADLQFSRRRHRQSQLSGFSFSRSATPEKLVQSPEPSASGNQSPEGSYANRRLSNLSTYQPLSSDTSGLSNGLRIEQSGKSPAGTMAKSRISRISLSYDRFSYGSPFQFQNIARALSRNSNVSDAASQVEEQLANEVEVIEEKPVRNSTTSDFREFGQNASTDPREVNIRQSQSSQQSRYSDTVSSGPKHMEHAYHLDQSHMSNSTSQTETENDEIVNEPCSMTMSRRPISIASASSLICRCDNDHEEPAELHSDIVDKQRAPTTLVSTEVVSPKLLPETPVEQLNELRSLVSANLISPFSDDVLSYEFPWMEPQPMPSPGRMNRNGRPPPLTLVDTHVPPPEVHSAALPPRSSSKAAMRDYAAQQAFVKRHHRRMTIAGAKDQLDIPRSPNPCIDSDVPPVPDLLYAEGTTTSPPSHSPATPREELNMREPDMRQLEEPLIEEEEVIETMDLPKSKSSLKRRGMFIEDPKDMLPQVGRSYESNMYATNLAEIDSTPIEHVSDIQPKNSLIRKKSIIGRLVHKHDSDEFLDYYFTAGQPSRTEHSSRHRRSRSISKKFNPFRHPRHGDYNSPPVPVHI